MCLYNVYEIFLDQQLHATYDANLGCYMRQFPRIEDL
jgi:hypothetical protein